MLTADDLRRILQDTKPDARGAGRGVNASRPILTDCDLELAARLQVADPAAGIPEEVFTQWSQGEAWSMRGSSESLEAFLERVVGPALRRGGHMVEVPAGLSLR